MSVTQKLLDGIGLVTINNPPVNALSHPVRRDLRDRVAELALEPTCKMIVITGQGKAFIGGADIKEFGRPALAPSLPDVIETIESCQKPTIAFINGYALGGGLEVALGCRFRVAKPTAILGLPEVKLGLIPGAGGTQRLPRLVGMEKALNMISTGDPIDANTALSAGLIDKIASESECFDGPLFWRNLIEQYSARPAMSELKVDSLPADILQQKIDYVKKKSRGQKSPIRAVEAALAGASNELADGLKIERRIFLELMNDPQRAALLYGFFGERKTKQVPGLEESPMEVKHIGIIGAGTMGSTIAYAFARAGFHVHLIDKDENSLLAAKKKLEKILNSEVARKMLTASQATLFQNKIEYDIDIHSGTNADLWIEAASENMDVKKAIFRTLDDIAKPNAILATNTSYLDINEIAVVTKRASSVVGMHFFNPAHRMRLLEIIRTDFVSDSVLSTIFRLGKTLGKVGVVAGVCNGFIGNRILKAYRKQSEYMIEDGALPESIDKAMRELGFPMGPFEMSDLAGLDIGWASRRQDDARRSDDERYVDIADKLYEMGRLGQKTLSGWYKYSSDSRVPNTDPIVTELIVESSRQKSISRKSIESSMVQENVLLTMINEGARILQEKIASKPSDIDMVMVHGYGFPKHLGGPMYQADQMGLKTVLAKLREREEIDSFFWAPSELLLELVKSDRNFSDLNDEVETASGGPNDR